jgi:hypothetical protein
VQGKEDGKDVFTISIVKLDEFLAERNSEPDLVKIDVEGFEMEVLRGAEQTFKRCRPELFIELDDNNLRRNKSSAAELVGFIENMGYEVRRALDGEKVSANSTFQGAHFDIHCVPLKQVSS